MKYRTVRLTKEKLSDLVST